MPADGKRLFVIIQARMTSTRLPGKVMLPLCGKSVLEIMLERLERFRDAIIIATTDDGSEAPIVELCESAGVRFYRGDTDDVLARYYEAAVHFGATDNDVIVRLTSDCPLIDPEIVQTCIDRFNTGGADYCSNIVSRRYPRGLDCEVFSFHALKQAHLNATLPMEREHVTPYIHTTHKAQFALSHVSNRDDDSRYRLTLDEAEDYEMITRLYALLECRTDFDYATLIGTLRRHGDIAAINAHVEQKKL